MTVALGALASLVDRVIWFVSCPRSINLIKLDLLVKSGNSSVYGSPEGRIPGVWLEFVIVGKQPCIADNAVIEASRHLVP
jgi:hypothetical protein